MPYQFEHIPPDTQQRLLEICTILGEIESLDHYLQEIACASVELTDAEYSAVFVFDRFSNKLLLAATAPVEFSGSYSLPTDSVIATEVLDKKQPLIINLADDDRRSIPLIAPNQPEEPWNLIALPLIARMRIDGVLIGVNKKGSLPFEERDIEISKFLASQAAIATEFWSLFQQTDLIADFMHELKTPMMALTAASELLAREGLLEKQSELVEMIQEETMRLSRIAQDFLDLARLDSGRVEFARDSIDFTKMINEVVRLQRPQADVRNISIESSVVGPIPDMIGDYERLKRVLINLTNNAIKYNVTGGQVKITAIAKDQKVIIAVSDTGPGISEEDLPHIFERFYRLADREGFTEGTGLGLPISARIVQEHGGHIEVESKKNEGSTFRCFLPISGC